MTDIELALVEYDGNGDYPYCDLVYKGLKLLQKKQGENENNISQTDDTCVLGRKKYGSRGVWE